MLSSDLDSVERNDILYYLLYAVVAKVLNKKVISFHDLHNLDMALITKEEIDNLKVQICKKYRELGGNSRVAKSPKFINTIYEILGFSS